MNTAIMPHEDTFVGISAEQTAEIVGPEAAALLHPIDHEWLTHGRDWRWIGRQVFTPHGLQIIAEQLRERGLKGAAIALETETRRRMEKARPAPVPDPISPRFMPPPAVDGPYANFHDADEDLP
jgi:hypothetical protein